MASIYFVLTVLFTIGYGDIVAVSFMEKCFVIIFMFIGVMCYCYSLSYLTNIYIQSSIQQTLSNKKNEFLEQSYFHFQYSSSILKEMLSSKHHNHKPEFITEFCQQILITRLPKNIQQEILKHIFHDIILKFDILQDRSLIFHMMFFRSCSV